EPPKDCDDAPGKSMDTRATCCKPPTKADAGSAGAPNPSLIARLQLRVSETQLARMTVRQLNGELRERGVTGEHARMIKHLRRTLKNRGYAAVCRTRRVAQRSGLEQIKGELKTHVDTLREQNEELAAEVERIDHDYVGLARWCLERGIPLPEDIRQDALS
ncbi:unnamed protein product, partial [Ixodes hexagonus]